MRLFPIPYEFYNFLRASRVCVTKVLGLSYARQSQARRRCLPSTFSSIAALCTVKNRRQPVSFLLALYTQQYKTTIQNSPSFELYFTKALVICLISKQGVPALKIDATPFVSTFLALTADSMCDQGLPHAQKLTNFVLKETSNRAAWDITWDKISFLTSFRYSVSRLSLAFLLPWPRNGLGTPTGAVADTLLICSQSRSISCDNAANVRNVFQVCLSNC